MSTWKEVALTNVNVTKISYDLGEKEDGSIGRSGSFGNLAGIPVNIGADKGGLYKETHPSLGVAPAHRDISSSANNASILFASRVLDLTPQDQVHYGIGPGINIQAEQVTVPDYSFVLPIHNMYGEKGVYTAANWAMTEGLLVNGSENITIPEFEDDAAGQVTSNPCTWTLSQLTWESSNAQTALGSNTAIAVEQGGTMGGVSVPTANGGECWFTGSQLTMNSGGGIETNTKPIFQIGEDSNFDNSALSMFVMNKKNDVDANGEYCTPYMFKNIDGDLVMAKQSDIETMFLHHDDIGANFYSGSLPELYIENFIIETGDTPTTGYVDSDGETLKVENISGLSNGDTFYACQKMFVGNFFEESMASLDKFVYRESRLEDSGGYIDWSIKGTYDGNAGGDPDRIILNVDGVAADGTVYAAGNAHPDDDPFNSDYSGTAHVFARTLYEMYSGEKCKLTTTAYQHLWGTLPSLWLADQTNFVELVTGGIVYNQTSEEISNGYGFEYSKEQNASNSANPHIETVGNWKSTGNVFRSTKLAASSGSENTQYIHDAAPGDTVGQQGEVYLANIDSTDKVYICVDSATV